MDMESVNEPVTGVTPKNWFTSRHDLRHVFYLYGMPVRGAEHDLAELSKAKEAGGQIHLHTIFIPEPGVKKHGDGIGARLVMVSGDYYDFHAFVVCEDVIGICDDGFASRQQDFLVSAINL